MERRRAGNSPKRINHFIFSIRQMSATVLAEIDVQKITPFKDLLKSVKTLTTHTHLSFFYNASSEQWMLMENTKGHNFFSVCVGDHDGFFKSSVGPHARHYFSEQRMSIEASTLKVITEGLSEGTECKFLLCADDSNSYTLKEKGGVEIQRFFCSISSPHDSTRIRFPPTSTYALFELKPSILKTMVEKLKKGYTAKDMPLCTVILLINEGHFEMQWYMGDNNTGRDRVKVLVPLDLKLEFKCTAARLVECKLALCGGISTKNDHPLSVKLSKDLMRLSSTPKSIFIPSKKQKPTTNRKQPPTKKVRSRGGLFASTQSKINISAFANTTGKRPSITTIEKEVQKEGIVEYWMCSIEEEAQ